MVTFSVRSPMGYRGSVRSTRNTTSFSDKVWRYQPCTFAQTSKTDSDLWQVGQHAATCGFVMQRMSEGEPPCPWYHHQSAAMGRDGGRCSPKPMQVWLPLLLSLFLVAWHRVTAMLMPALDKAVTDDCRRGIPTDPS